MVCLLPCGAVFAQQQAPSGDQAQPAAKTSGAEDDLKYETLKVRKEGAVLFVEIAAPPMNLLGPELVRDLVSLIQRAEADNAVKVLVFKSADPDYFISHVDVTKIKEYRQEAAKLVGEPSIGLLFRHLSASRLVTIAQIEGRVRGAGSEFVLACDMRYAARESAIFGQPEPGLGTIPGAGAVQHLTRLMGRARALEVLLSADDYDAELAERYGWINRALPVRSLDGFVRSLAHRIARFPSAGHVTVKDRVNAIALKIALSLSSSSSSGGIGTLVFNLGVQGDSGTLQLFVSRLPRDVTGGLNPNDPTVVQPSDLRRITYWLAGDPSNPLGLARQEVTLITAPGATDLTPPLVADESSYVIAPEVRSLSFSYFDGTQWQDTWDGTQPGGDGVTPMGPPLAIAVVIGITQPGSKATDAASLKYYRHVIAIQTANNPTPQQTQQQSSGGGTSP